MHGQQNIKIYHEVCANPNHQLAKATRFCGVAHNACWSSVLKWLRVATVAPRILSRITGLCQVLLV